MGGGAANDVILNAAQQKNNLIQCYATGYLNHEVYISQPDVILRNVYYSNF